jgi:hypothetical protein
MIKPPALFMQKTISLLTLLFIISSGWAQELSRTDPVDYVNTFTGTDSKPTLSKVNTFPAREKIFKFR